MKFENDVKMYGTQTFPPLLIFCNKFENDVKMYGTQTIVDRLTGLPCEILLMVTLDSPINALN